MLFFLEGIAGVSAENGNRHASESDPGDRAKMEPGANPEGEAGRRRTLNGGEAGDVPPALPRPQGHAGAQHAPVVPRDGADLHRVRHNRLVDDGPRPPRRVRRPRPEGEHEGRTLVVPRRVPRDHDAALRRDAGLRGHGVRAARLLPPLRRQDVLTVRDTAGAAR